MGCNSCCGGNCTFLTKYKIEELFDCNIQNWEAIPTEILINIKDCKLYNFLSEEEIENAFNYIDLYWCYFIKRIPIYFRNYYVTENLKKLQEYMYIALTSYLNENIIKLIYYIQSLNYKNHKNQTNREGIFSVNDEPERQNISGTDDFMKTNISRQTATNEKNNTTNPNLVFNEIMNRENFLESFFYDVADLIKGIIRNFTPQLNGTTCSF